MPLNDAKINELLERWIQDVVPSKEEFFKKLKREKLTIYHGVDPTSPDIHLGHSTNYLLMRVFHQMGHRIVLLIGDFTAMIGDPSGRTTERVPLTEKEVKTNYKTYENQVGKILNFNSKENPIEVRHNSEWLKKLTFKDVVEIAGHFTVQQMISRDMFQKRLREGNPIGLHEFLYPLMQGYDSVALNTDAEIGGNDQLFNMMAGRDLVKDYKKKEKFIVTTKLLINPKTSKKLMSKSEGGYIAFNDSAFQMYGKTMALPDEVVANCFQLCTELDAKKIEETEKLSEKERKEALAREIVRIYYGEEEAKKAEYEFNKTFKEKRMPDQIEEFKSGEKFINITNLLIQAGIRSSKGEVRRLIEQGGVHINTKSEDLWERIDDPEKQLEACLGAVIRVGKRRFVRLSYKP